MALMQALIACGASGLSRTETPRSVNAGAAHYVEGTESGRLFVSPGARELKWTWSDASGARGQEVARLTLPAFRVGGVSSLDARRFLVVGRVPGGDGVIVRVRCMTSPKRQVLIDEIKLYVGMDLVGASWNSVEQRLYALDYLAKKVVFAAWDGPASGLPASFALAVDATTQPILNAELVNMIISCDQIPAGFSLWVPPSNIECRIRQVGTQWVARRVAKTGSY